ncbi:hypothetical protein [Halobaculum limi]|uniref:hypothetical protein n=1 Tax=Halobaculum limi TaxID=3031916 RepID=UPI0024049A33|nr:hypothetical protein [Halobaculum sp. YSMS11]
MSAPAAASRSALEGSDAEALLDKLEDVTGYSLDEWLDEMNAGDGAQVWHVPAWLASSNHAPVQDSELGSIIIGVPHRETEKAVKFDNWVTVLVLHRKRRVEHVSGGRKMTNYQEWDVEEIDKWESAVQECVGEDDEWQSFCPKRVRSSDFWPYSEMTRID